MKKHRKIADVGLIAYCSVCGCLQGFFQDERELIRKMAEQRRCLVCGVVFGFEDGKIWNLRIECLPPKEEVVVKLLDELENYKQQHIFCYEDRGPESLGYRYPQKRMKFYWYGSTDIASPAYVLQIYDKGNYRKVEKAYCFDSPYALLSLAREALKGYKWLKKI